MNGKYYIEERKSIPVREQVDVLVVGGGPAGLMAAAAARKTGAQKVLILERYGFLGGMLTAGGVLNIRTFNDSRENLVIKGLPMMFINKLKEYKGIYGSPEKDDCVRHDPMITRYVADRFCIEHGVEMLLHTYVVEVMMNENYMRGVIIESKSGRQAIEARVVVDASGDADVCALAGVPFEKGDMAGELQPMSATFIMGGAAEDTWPDVLPPERKKLCDELYKRGLYPIKKIGVGIFPLFRNGEAYVNATRLKGDATNVEDFTRAEIEGRQQIMDIIAFWRQHITGFENCCIVGMAPQVGVRETRRIKGEYTLTGEDVLEARDFDSGIARGYYMIDIHGGDDTTKHVNLKPGTSYSIPYGCLVPQSVDGLLAAGRCISATREGQSSCRVMAICMAIGQAAGAAAALSVIENIPPRKLSVPKLREILKSQDVIL